MRRATAILALLLMPAAPLAAQVPQATLDRLAFMAGCWSGPVVIRGSAGTLEERWSPPSTNAMQGTSRTLLDGRTVDFEFMLVTTDSTGAVLTPYPRGVRSPDGFRLTRMDGDTAVFEAPQHDYPKRIIYARAAAGLTARIDGGAGDTVPRIWPMTSVACTARPGALAAAPETGPKPAAASERNGRVLLYVTQTLNGLWLGLAVPAMFNADDPTSYGLGLLLGAPTGILFARIVDTSKPVSLGQATAIGWGGWWGWWNGFGIYGMGDNADETDFFRNTVIGMVGGTAAGLVLARRPINAGDASLVAHASVWGTWFGAVITVLAESGDDDGWKIVLGAGNAALLAAAVATPRVDITAGRVWVTTASGIAGLVAGLGIDLIVQADDDKTAILIPAITSGIGLATGMALSRGLDRREARGPELAPEPTLLGVRDGRARLGLPFPQPAMVPRDDGRTRRWVPGMRLTLFEWTH